MTRRKSFNIFRWNGLKCFFSFTEQTMQIFLVFHKYKRGKLEKIGSVFVRLIRIMISWLLSLAAMNVVQSTFAVSSLSYHPDYSEISISDFVCTICGNPIKCVHHLKIEISKISRNFWNRRFCFLFEFHDNC